jgi:hypothetical protein
MKSEVVSNSIIRIKWGESANYKVGGLVNLGGHGRAIVSAITTDIDHHKEFGILRYVIWVKIGEQDYLYKSINEGTDGLELTFNSTKDFIKL